MYNFCGFCSSYITQCRYEWRRHFRHMPHHLFRTATTHTHHSPIHRHILYSKCIRVVVPEKSTFSLNLNNNNEVMPKINSHTDEYLSSKHAHRSLYELRPQLVQLIILFEPFWVWNYIFSNEILYICRYTKNNKLKKSMYTRACL